LGFRVVLDFRRRAIPYKKQHFLYSDESTRPEVLVDPHLDHRKKRFDEAEQVERVSVPSSTQHPFSLESFKAFQHLDEAKNILMTDKEG
jgi:hypothetical protein